MSTSQAVQGGRNGTHRHGGWVPIFIRSVHIQGLAQNSRHRVLHALPTQLQPKNWSQAFVQDGQDSAEANCDILSCAYDNHVTIARYEEVACVPHWIARYPTCQRHCSNKYAKSRNVPMASDAGKLKQKKANDLRRMMSNTTNNVNPTTSSFRKATKVIERQ